MYGMQQHWADTCWIERISCCKKNSIDSKMMAAAILNFQKMDFWLPVTFVWPLSICILYQIWRENLHQRPRYGRKSKSNMASDTILNLIRSRIFGQIILGCPIAICVNFMRISSIRHQWPRYCHFTTSPISLENANSGQFGIFFCDCAP